jgi:tetratricopeptide (TPR) repeat protein
MQFFGLASALYENALRHHQAGRLQEAEQGYLQALAQNPRHYESLHMMGMLAGQVGRNDMALDYTDQAIAVNPNVAEAHANRGYALAALGRFEEAEASFRRSVALKPDYAAAHAGLAELKARAERANPPPV